MFTSNCTGIKRCEYLRESLRCVSHTHWTLEIEENMRMQNKYIEATGKDTLQRNATKYVSGTFPIRSANVLMVLGNTSESMSDL